MLSEYFWSQIHNSEKAAKIEFAAGKGVAWCQYNTGWPDRFTNNRISSTTTTSSTGTTTDSQRT